MFILLRGFITFEPIELVTFVPPFQAWKGDFRNSKGSSMVNNYFVSTNSVFLFI